MIAKTRTLLLCAAAFGAMVTSCKKDSDSSGTGGTDSTTTTISKYVIAAVSGTATYFLNVNSLDSGTTTTTGNGIEDTYTYTHYAYNGTKGMIALNYQQGDPAIGKIYGLDATGELAETGAGFQLTDGFNSLGPFGNYIVTCKNTMTLTDGSIGSSFYFIDLNNNATVTNKTITTTNLVGNGLETTLIGIVDAGDGNFLSAAWPTNGSADSCFVVKFDANLAVKQIYKDDRIGYAAGSYRSARYSLIANDDDGNTYVFASPIVTKTNAAGALRINKGESTFDQSYHFDIEALSGGYLFRKVWHITGDYFLLEFYNTTTPGNTATAYQYAMVNTENKTFNWISGLPSVDVITNVGWPYSDGSKAYIPVTTSTANPTVYVVDPATASAKAGIVVSGATSIGGLAHLTY